MGKVIVVYGPEGCGKTKNTQGLMKELGCSQSFDNRSLLSDLVSADNTSFINGINALVLTNSTYDVVVSAISKMTKGIRTADVISFYDILPRLAKHTKPSEKYDDEKIIDFFQAIADGNLPKEFSGINLQDLHKLNRLCSLAMIGLEAEKERELCSEDVTQDCDCEEEESEDQRNKKVRVIEERVHGITHLYTLGLLSKSEYNQRIYDIRLDLI